MNQTHILIEYSNARPLARERKRFSFFLTTRTLLKQTDGANEKMRQAHADKTRRRRSSSRASLFEVQVHADPMEAREEEERGEEEEEEKNQQRGAQKYDDADKDGNEKTERTPPPGRRRRRRRRRRKQRERRREETGETVVKNPRETATMY